MSLLTWFLEPKFSTLHFDLLVKKYWYFSIYFLVSGSWCHTVLTFKPTERWQRYQKHSADSSGLDRPVRLSVPWNLGLFTIYLSSHHCTGYRFTANWQSRATQEAASRQTQTNSPSCCGNPCSWHSGLLENVPFTFFKLLFLTVLKKHSKTQI